MRTDPHDTIVALSSAPGPGGRAVVRVSGPNAFPTVFRLFSPDVSTAVSPTLAGERRCVEGSLALPGVSSRLPAGLHLWPGPASFTGQDVAEVHTISCPPLVELVVARLLASGCRAAGPGEFTQRAFLAGKLDLTRAEAVLAVIEAGDRDELAEALARYAGNLAAPLRGLRDELLNLLADVEAGLDFAEEDLRFVEPTELLIQISRGLAHLTNAKRQLESRGLADDTGRAVLVGPPNAGKSSLFNALTGTDAALVNPAPGTTRDYLVRRVTLGTMVVELTDTAGRAGAADDIETQAQVLGRERAARADVIVWCHPTTAPLPGANGGEPGPIDPGRATVIRVATKCDLSPAPPGWVPTSAATGEGIEGLRDLIASAARGRKRPALVPGSSRCLHHIITCLDGLRRVHALVLAADPPELVAFELRGAIDELGELVGAVYTDDLLDRIFSRFCIGK